MAAVLWYREQDALVDEQWAEAIGTLRESDAQRAAYDAGLRLTTFTAWAWTAPQPAVESLVAEWTKGAES